MYHRDDNYRKMVSEVLWLEGLLMTEQHRKDATLIVRHDDLCQSK